MVRYGLRRTVTTILVVVMMICGSAACAPVPQNSVSADDVDNGPLKVTYIDVGKGDCIVMQTDTYVTMIDTGYENTVDRVSAYLDAEGISAIDDMIITHFDKDHYGGMMGLMERYPVKHIFLPDYESASSGYIDIMEALGIDKASIESRYEVHVDHPADTSVKGEPVVTFVYEDTGYSIDHMEGGSDAGSYDFIIYASQTEYDPNEKNDNDMSLITTLTFNKDSYVFFGDIEKDAVEAYLKRDYGRRHYDIMKLPHHGDWKKNYDDLISAAAPIEVIITDGEDRPAKDKLIEYLDESGISYYSTYRDGTIVIHSGGTGAYGITSAS